ncbi:hypothetical protein [Mycobacterium angelicum]|uniref:Uncharacterized protein n=1 Tax=Mycobacterium angelicum TaxID=470074 RepID=A0A1W9ZS56_MYCAN|nr:hypothetical protein [Mycobacterium angelicum]MCV7199320.1 hypothetical protein [Mycobacterium angelicum]ORA20523.1 hypothetical protein BST12_15315 [Mycobacterium angelicum]
MSAGGTKTLASSLWDNKPARWAIKSLGTVAAAIFMAAVTPAGPWIVQSVHDLIWGRGPLVVAHTEPMLDGIDPPDTWELVVPDPHALPPVPRPSPPQLPAGKDCADLWHTGLKANGQPPNSAKYKLTLWGQTDVTIVDLRAELLRHFPPSGGALLRCAPSRMGPPVPDEPTSCDLSQRLDADRYAPCTVKDAAGQVALLRNSKTIPLHKGGDSTTLQVNVKLPNDSVEWKLEVHVTTPDGTDRWVDVGRNFRSTGLRQMNAGQFYDEYICASELGVISWKPGDPTPPPPQVSPSEAPRP